MTLAQPLERIYNYIQEKSNDKYYIYKLSILLLIVCWVLTTPNALTYLYKYTKETYSWDAIVLKSQDLTNNLSHIPPYENPAKKVFRLTIPVLIRFFHFNQQSLVIIQILMGLYMYIMSYRLTVRLTKDNVIASLVTMAMPFLYFGKAAYVHLTWFDGYSFFFLLAAMYSRNVLLIFLLSSMAAWNDERAFIALSIVFLYHLVANMNGNKMTFKNIVQSNKQAWAVIIAILGYLFVRFYLTTVYNMHTPTAGANINMIIKRTIDFIPIAAFTFAEGYWVLIITGFALLFYNKDRLLAWILLLPIGIMTIVASCVSDMSRSGAHLFLYVYIFLAYLSRHLTQNQLRALTLFCTFVTFIFPPLFVGLDHKVESWVQDFLSLDKISIILKR